MTHKSIQIGQQEAHFNKKRVEGELVELHNEKYYKIRDYDGMRPFFMSIVSDSNHWMFISSSGGLTAGRKNSDNALFPYYTDDKITESADITGSKTIIKVHGKAKSFLWEPFSSKYAGVYDIRRNLYKNSHGDKVIFEEINKDLDMTYRYHWNTSDEYGFVKRSELINHRTDPIRCSILDGIQNVLPASVGEDLQKASSNLVDAYKRSELKEDCGMGIIALSAVIVDKAEPSEALKATTVWSLGLNNPKYLLSSLQLDNFRKGFEIEQETDVKAERGAYFTVSEVSIDAGASKNWYYLADVNQTIVSINKMAQQIKTDANLEEKILEDIDLGSHKLVKLVAASDGLQLTADPLNNMRHFSNTMFNIMRGGIFDDNYSIDKDDFTSYLKAANHRVFKDANGLIGELPETFSYFKLRELANGASDKDFKRLALEYLPLKFSRRHGDPSRPWNKFSINTRSEEDGSKILDYEGNWRDIFQNWEALALSYPEFMEGMIHKFLNATTFDGYNPYRVTKGGFDWEVVEEDNPWSYIGYWGDHQIIYLLKFLEFIEEYQPGRLASLTSENVFVYANVPYEIKSYEDQLENPKDTIVFDHDSQERIEKLREDIGVDGALLMNRSGEIYHVNLMEKLLATVLAKMSNFIPEAGIWLNTQRPEWNDANNALVGNGVSMVTLYYLRRFMNFLRAFVEQTDVDSVHISAELEKFFSAISISLQESLSLLDGSIDDLERRKILDQLAKPASDYRRAIYANKFSGEKSNISMDDVKKFVDASLKFIDHSIDANKREDGMYHAYNLMNIKDNDEISVSYLSEMLEGQVAVLSSGYLTAAQALQVMDGLKSSSLFREDQYSYILYPNKELPGFEEKNNIPAQAIEKSMLLKELLKNKNKQIVVQDIKGSYHFNANFNNVNSLRKALKQLPETYQALVTQERKQLEQTFELVFNHKSFTGRSGTFFGYEGLGSIYWHMVSKLLLAVQESSLRAMQEGASDKIIGRMLDHYYEIQAGIGVHKSPKLYGAVPTDPYSHTPATKGAQQPGMTGQVKEDILSRFGELGINVDNGKLRFQPSLLRKEEFLNESQEFEYLDVNQETRSISINSGSLAFTYCQVPVIYTMGEQQEILVNYTDETSDRVSRLELDDHLSDELFQRSNRIKSIEVTINK